MKAVVLDGYTLNPGDLSWDSLKELVELTIYERTDETNIGNRIAGAKIILTNKTKITKEIIDRYPDIKYIGVLATGYNVVDIDQAKLKNIIVTNVPAYSTNSVSQLVFAFILEVCHHTMKHSEAVKEGKWSSGKDFCFWDYPLIELAGKTMGIIGYGNIGQKVAQIAQCFGIRVLVYVNSVKENLSYNGCTLVDLSELYKNADIISLHVPLTSQTKDMINEKAFALMKTGVILINTSRGELIIEHDLIDALNIGKVSYACLDVVRKEPIEIENPLLKVNNVFLTPHIAWATKEARARLLDTAVSNVRAFLKGKPINVVNGVKL